MCKGAALAECRFFSALPLARTEVMILLDWQSFEPMLEFVFVERFVIRRNEMPARRVLDRQRWRKLAHECVRHEFHDRRESRDGGGKEAALQAARANGISEWPRILNDRHWLLALLRFYRVPGARRSWGLLKVMAGAPIHGSRAPVNRWGLST